MYKLRTTQGIDQVHISSDQPIQQGVIYFQKETTHVVLKFLIQNKWQIHSVEESESNVRVRSLMVLPFRSNILMSDREVVEKRLQKENTGFLRFRLLEYKILLKEREVLIEMKSIWDYDLHNKIVSYLIENALSERWLSDIFDTKK